MKKHWFGVFCKHLFSWNLIGIAFYMEGDIKKRCTQPYWKLLKDFLWWKRKMLRHSFLMFIFGKLPIIIQSPLRKRNVQKVKYAFFINGKEVKILEPPNYRRIHIVIQ